MKLSPTAMGQRVESLDMMRGLSLLGIFIANMLFFHTPVIYVDLYTFFNSYSDQATYKWISIFIEGSFYPIFAILFGYGLNMQFEKTRSLGTPFAPVVSRRLSLLLLFGLIHGLLIWAGDILLAYAVMGFFVILFVRLSAKWILMTASLLYIIPSGALIGLMFLIEKTDPHAADGTYANIQQFNTSITAYSTGSFSDIFVQRFHDWLQIGVLSGIVTGFFTILPLILIGVVLSKWKLFEKAAQNKRKLALIAIIFVPVGLGLKLLPFINKPVGSVQLLKDLFGGPILGMGYIALFLLLIQISFIYVVCRPLAKVGKMSLTVYISQSIIATLIFYSYGFGLYGKVDLALGTWMAIGIFAIQVLFAELWFSKFRMGPLEWIWRKGTYGKKLANKEEKC